jgi:quercetin dioxygenase-like cupin family protein
MNDLPAAFAQLGQHDKHPWRPLPWNGTHNKVLYFDRVSGATIELAKIDKGAEFPEHYHSSVQTLFLVSGSFGPMTPQ